MSEGTLLDILRQGLWTALVMSLPTLAVILFVGLAIGLFQALTSIQEMTLAFVPKLAAVLVVVWFSLGTMGQAIVGFFTDAIIPLIEGS